MKKIFLVLLLSSVLLSSCENPNQNTYLNKTFYKQQDQITFEGDIISIKGNILTINTESFKDFDTIDVKIPDASMIDFVPYETLHVRVTVKDEMAGGFPPSFKAITVIPLGEYERATKENNRSV